jgi:uncharacterized membrane protein YgcG
MLPLHACPTSSPTNRSPRGMVLVIVLVVVAIMSLAAYTFSETMVIEARGVASFGRDVQARALADSAVELAASMLSDTSSRNPETLNNNPGAFRNILLRPGVGPKGQGRFSIVAGVASDDSGTLLRSGLSDESSKLNLNAMLKGNEDDLAARAMLMNLPNMSEEIADAILDWIDSDITDRPLGAESDYYLTLATPYEPPNGPLDSLDDLLLVRGVTPELLYGEDANRNGLMDPNENDGELSPPFDNADGLLDRGWMNYLTIYSREINTRADGEERINVNQGLLTELYDALEEELGEEVATFVVAYRINGPLQTASPSSNTSGGTASSGGSGSSGRTSSSGGAASGGASGASTASTARSITPTNSTLQPINATAPSITPTSSGGQTVTANQAANALGEVLGNALFGGQGQTVTRGGMDVSKGGPNQIKSLYDLVGVQVRATINNTQTTLESPWTSDPGTMRGYAAELFEALSIRADQYVEGRININEAPREILLGLPGMTEQLAESIVGSQLLTETGESQAGQVSDRATTAWLYFNGWTDLDTLRQLDPYITSRGDVFRVQAVGFYDGGGPFARVEAILDGTRPRPTILLQRDLTDLGRGFTLPQLSGETP